MSLRVLGIDAGGTATHARMCVGSRRVFDRRSGRANISSTPVDEIAKHLADATSGCPEPDVVAGCFAGLASPHAAAIALGALQHLFPDAEHRLAPDYVAVALASFDADVVVLAGTGSVVVSRTNEGIATTGGLGHLLGDRGSAFRYGQALLEHVLLNGLSEMPDYVFDDLRSAFGSSRRADIIRTVYGSAGAVEVIARLAPTLSRLASEQSSFAMQLVDEHADALAKDVTLHVERHLDRSVVRAEAAGGVWQSAPIYESFRRSLEVRLAPRAVHVRRASHLPVEGALRLGSLARDEIDGLVQLTRPGPQ